MNPDSDNYFERFRIKKSRESYHPINPDADNYFEGFRIKKSC